jgi:hypothetical protein
MKIMTIHSEQCKRLGIPLWGNAMPGYDDSGVRPDQKHHPIPRLEGEFFKKSLNDAMKISAQCITVTSFNEIYEDSHIEPCQSYGSLYLNIMSHFKASLK